MNRESPATNALVSLRTIGCELERRVGVPQVERRPLFRFSGWGCAIFLVLLLVAVPQAWSQQQATASGIITDPSGAVIPGATIRVTNRDTQVTTTAVANSTGYYLVVNLIPGTYTITAQKEGFKTATRSALTLQVAQSAPVDFQLELGQMSAEVTVHATPPLLVTSDATVGQVIDPTTMVEMPLNGRNYFNLAELAPGVSSYGLRSSYSSALNDYGTSFNSGSAGEDRNGFTLDGADIKQYLVNGSYVPSIDAIQEFKIETTPYAADLGTSPGAQILLVTKSGTDQFHGSLTNSFATICSMHITILTIAANRFRGNVNVRLAGADGALVTIVAHRAHHEEGRPDDFHRQLIRVIAELSDAAGAFLVRAVHEETRGWQWVTEPL